MINNDKINNDIKYKLKHKLWPWILTDSQLFLLILIHPDVVEHFPSQIVVDPMRGFWTPFQPPF